MEESPDNVLSLSLSWRALSFPTEPLTPTQLDLQPAAPPFLSLYQLVQELVSHPALGMSFHSLTFVLSPLLLPSQSRKPWQQEGVARETGLPSNQEFPASVSGVTGGFVSRAAEVRKERKMMRGTL